jgi:hypothetical protein
MTNPIDVADENSVTLRASADAAKLDATISLTIQGARIPTVGDDIEISFLDGIIAHAAVAFVDAYDFPVIEFRGERFTLVPAGRIGGRVSEESTGTRWLVTTSNTNAGK